MGTVKPLIATHWHCEIVVNWMFTIILVAMVILVARIPFRIFLDEFRVGDFQFISPDYRSS